MHPKLIVTAVAFFLSIGASVEAQQNCFAKYSKTNICDYAKKIQKGMAPNLPMQISQNLSLRNVVAIGPNISLGAMLDYDEQYLNADLRAKGVSRTRVDSRMKSMTRNGVCTDPVLRAFVDLGGIISYNYKFIDGSKYLDIRINKDSCE